MLSEIANPRDITPTKQLQIGHDVPETEAEIGPETWHNYDRLNQDESVSAAGGQRLSEREQQRCR